MTTGRLATARTALRGVAAACCLGAAHAAFADAAADTFGPLDASPPELVRTAAPARPAAPAPLYLSIADDDSIYAPPAPPREDEGVNEGAVHFDLEARYLNHYVYRGVDRSSIGGEKGSSLNLQLEGRAEFDLGKFPHPFIGGFTNVYDGDPVSRFQELRPYFGATLNLRPILLEGGHNSYIFPEREKFNTNEVYGKLTLDDGVLLGNEHPLLSPYAYAAYDYDINNGWYFEAGVSHDFVFEEIGLTLTAEADVAYILGYQQQFVFPADRHDTGFQHYDVGMTATYALNTLLNFSRRYGEFDLKGYLYDTNGINGNLRHNNTLWGGAGLGFKY